MSLTVKEEGGSFVQCPPGNHVARCYAVIDLGTQHQDAFNWEGAAVAASDKPQGLIMWECPNEMVEIEGEMKPAGISKFYNMFFTDRASLRIHLEAWRGKPFTQEELTGFYIGNLIGKPCMVNVVHTDKSKAKVAGIAAIPKGLQVPEQINDSIMFDLGEYDQAVFESISEGIQNIIKRSPEWQAINAPKQGFRQTENPAPFEDDDLDEVPF